MNRVGRKNVARAKATADAHKFANSISEDAIVMCRSTRDGTSIVITGTSTRVSMVKNPHARFVAADASVKPRQSAVSVYRLVG